MSKIMTKFYSLPDTTRDNIELAITGFLGGLILFISFWSVIFFTLFFGSFIYS